MRPLYSLAGLALLAALAACSDSATSGSDDGDAQLLDDAQGGGSLDGGATDDAAAPGPSDATDTDDAEGSGAGGGSDAGSAPDAPSSMDVDDEGSTPGGGGTDTGPGGETDSGSDGGGGTDIDESPDVDPGLTFQPDIGIWQYNVQPIRDNTCGRYAVSDGSTPFRIVRSADGEFEIEQEEGASNFVCQITGTTFVCPNRLRGSNPIPDTDAVVSFNVAIEGVLISDAELEGSQTVNVSCAGSSCAFAPAVLGVTFPCSYVVDFTATAF